MAPAKEQEAGKAAADWYRKTYQHQGQVRILYPLHHPDGWANPEGDNWRLVIDESPCVGVLVKPDLVVEKQDTNFFKPNTPTRQVTYSGEAQA